MQEALINIQNDSTMMLIAGIAIVVLIVIVLVIVVSTMRVKAYKDDFQNLLLETKEKSEYIISLEKEAELSKVKHAKDKQELVLFDETKQTLEKTNVSCKTLQTGFNKNEKEMSLAKGKLIDLEKKHEALSTVHTEVQKKLESILEENSKIRTNNARLLMKLEQEERFSQELQEKGKKRKKVEKVEKGKKS